MALAPCPSRAGSRHAARPGETVVCRSAAANGEVFWEATWRHPHDGAKISGKKGERIESTRRLRWSAVVLVSRDPHRHGPRSATASRRPTATTGRPAGSNTTPAGPTCPHPHGQAAGRRCQPAVHSQAHACRGPCRRGRPCRADRCSDPAAPGDRRHPPARRPGADAPLAALADSCIGHAHVVDNIDPDLTNDLTDQLGGNTVCTPGHAGLLRGPGSNRPPRRHHMVMPGAGRSPPRRLSC